MHVVAYFDTLDHDFMYNGTRSARYKTVKLLTRDIHYGDGVYIIRTRGRYMITVHFSTSEEYSGRMGYCVEVHNPITRPVISSLQSINGSKVSIEFTVIVDIIEQSKLLLLCLIGNDDDSYLPKTYVTSPNSVIIRKF